MNNYHIWVLFCAFLVFLMQPGFLLLESGLCRSKNSVNIALKNSLDFSLSSLIYWTVGYAFMFGISSSDFIGSGYFFFYPETSNPSLAVHFIFQTMFCGAVVTIISGAIAERIKLAMYFVIVLIVSSIIYPILGHWLWSSGVTGHVGFLAKQGFVDFAGGTVVHSAAGWVSLALLLIIGPRKGRYDRPLHITDPFKPSNSVNALLGVFLLAIGWFGFNAGSVTTLSTSIPLICINTMLGGSAGLFFGLIFSWMLYDRASARFLIVGFMAGLVAITPGCHLYDPLASILVGSAGSMIAILTIKVLDVFKIDDAVDAIPCHLSAGIWGTMAIPFFARPDQFLMKLSLLDQFGVQFKGVLLCGIWCFGVAFTLFYAVNRLHKFRVSSEEEEAGLDTLHDESIGATYE